MGKNNLNAYFIKVEPQREFVAEAILRQEGYEVSVPIIHRAKRAHRKAKIKSVSALPMYPGYVVIMFNEDVEPDWLNVMRFRMIHGVVGHDGIPLKIALPELRRMFLASSRPIRYVNTRGKKNFGRTYKAEIISGPFQGREVRVIEYTAEESRKRGLPGEVFEMYELFKVAA